MRGLWCFADSLDGLRPAPPFNILEPTTSYSGGEPREDGADNGSAFLQTLNTGGGRKAFTYALHLPCPVRTSASSQGSLTSRLRAVLSMEAPLQVLLMPGLAFDAAGRRCGRAGGYYDKLLARLLARAAGRGWLPPLLGAPSMWVQRGARADACSDLCPGR